MELITNNFSAIGLVLCLLGAIVLAWSQNKLFSKVTLWLETIDTTVDGLTRPQGDILRVKGMDKLIQKSLPGLKCASTAGWILMILGTAMQILSAM